MYEMGIAMNTDPDGQAAAGANPFMQSRTSFALVGPEPILPHRFIAIISRDSCGALAGTKPLLTRHGLSQEDSAARFSHFGTFTPITRSHRQSDISPTAET